MLKSIRGFLFFAAPSLPSRAAKITGWAVARFRYENVAYDPLGGGPKAEEFASLKLQLYNQISAGAPKSRRHLRGSWHFCPITRLNKLHLFPGTFRRENGLLGYLVQKKPGENAEFTLLRGGKPQKIQLTVP